MALIQENGSADWANNPDHLRILYSITKVHIKENNLKYIPVQEEDHHLGEIADKFSISVGEDIKASKIAWQLYFPFDSANLIGHITDQFMAKLRIGLEVGLIDKDIFRGMLKNVKVQNDKAKLMIQTR